MRKIRDGQHNMIDFYFVQYGHKINLATQTNGFVAYLNIKSGHPCDKTLCLPVLDVSISD